MKPLQVQASHLDIDTYLTWVVVLEDILSTRQGTHDLEVSVKCSTKDQGSATWETTYSIRKDFIDFSLEDKVEVMRGRGRGN